MRFIGNFDCFYGEKRYDEFASAHSAAFTGNGALLIDSALKGHSGVDFAVRSLADNGIRFTQTRIVELEGEPTYDFLDSLAGWARGARLEYLVAIGGGSVLDLAKGVALLLSNSGTGIQYRGMGLVENPPRPLLTIPTTAGTGSEVTWTASFIDSVSLLKLGINGPNVFPYASLLEPKILVESPPSVSTSAALDALVHAVEAVTSPMASDFTDPLAIRAVHLVVRHLPAVLNDPEAVDHWGHLQHGAFLAGLAMLNSSGGPASGVSYPIGVRFKVPHGFAGGILLPRVIAMNVEKGYSGYDVFLRQTGISEHDDPRASKAFLDWLTEFYSTIQAPSNFLTWGISTPQDVQAICDDTIQTRASSLRLNPVPFSEDDLRFLVESVCLE